MASSRRTRRSSRRGPPRGRGRTAAGAARTRIPPLRIRRASLADAAEISRVMRAAIRGLARDAYRPRQLAAWSSLPALYHAWAMTAGGERYLVAERAGRIVGYAAVRAGEVTAAFVRPAAARTGVGAALLARAERDVHRRGARSLFVRAGLPAVPFYRALGFRGERGIRVPLPGGGALEAVMLRKRLAPR